MAVSIARDGDIALLTVDNPPVNALSHAVRQGLWDAIAAAEADDTVRAVVIRATGRTFPAGADIREFGKPSVDPWLPAVVDRIEGCAKPVVAALHGQILGGGLEVAMGAHVRVCDPGARLGLPEVSLGILPGAGGTQRLPRLIPVDRALDMITTGKPISAAEARALGLVDAVSEPGEAVADAALAHARRLVADGTVPRPTGARPVHPAAPDLFETTRAALARTAKGRLAPLACVDAVEAATRLPLREGLAEERRLFGTLMESDQRAALIHAFLSERQVAKLPELEGVTSRPLERIGIVGGGTMGAGIAAAALLSGLPVHLVERGDDAAARARETVTGMLDGAVKRGKLDAETRAMLLSDAFATGTDYAALGTADLVVEAVFESMDAKREVFAALDAVCKPGAVLATNTSYLDVDALAATVSRPGDVLGLHFFSPAHVMRLLEVVVGRETAPDAVATGFALAKRLGKVAVRAGVCDGFIGNRVLSAYRKALDGAVLAGASPFNVDRALVDFGLAMGPYAVGDLSGLDIAWANRKRLAPTRDPRETYADFSDRLCEAGHLGRKTGRGFYVHGDGKPVPNPEVEAIVAAERAAKGIAPRPVPDAEIVARFVAATVNEGARIVGEGIARRPLDVDVTMLNGYGFPRWRGGPMHHADATGLARILADIERLAGEDAFLWRPAPLLHRLAGEGGRFADLDGG